MIVILNNISIVRRSNDPFVALYLHQFLSSVSCFHNVVSTVPFLLLSSLLLFNFRKLHLIVTQMHVTDILLCNIGHNHIVSVNNEKVLE